MAFADGYVDVATRIAQFKEKHPNGCLRPQNPDEPIKIIFLGDRTYLQYVACAYRDEEDPMPGVGIAWEPFPGKTSFTRDSEAMNAETSAWGRAIVAVLAADSKNIATSEEVRNRNTAPEPNWAELDNAINLLMTAGDRKAMEAAWRFAATHVLLDAHVDGIPYRELWKTQLEIVDGLGQETTEPAAVAPEEAEQVVAETLGGSVITVKHDQMRAEDAERDAAWLEGGTSADIPVNTEAGEKPNK